MKARYGIRVNRWRSSIRGCAWEVTYKDGTVKPNGEVDKRLVFDEWWTNERRTTDADGRCTVRGFHGDYRVEVEHATLGKTSIETTLDKPSASVTIKLK